jgi:hypothetical protein
VLFYREEQYEHFLENFQSKKQGEAQRQELSRLGQEKVFSPFDLG